MIDLSDPRTPTWPELQLDGHVLRLRVSLLLHVVTLALFWACMVGWLPQLDGILMPFLYGAFANYLFLVWSAFQIQQTLHESGLYKQAAWQVWVGALILNPLVLGWWIPVRVLVTARQTRRQLQGRWPDGRNSSA